MNASDDSPAPIHQWPAGPPIDPADALDTECPGCGASWRVHRDLAGFRLRCVCGGWIPMPQLPARTKPNLPLQPDAEPGSESPQRRDEQGRLELDLRPGETTDRPIPTSAPMAPGAVLHGNVRARQRWTNAAFLELGLMMLALLLPSIAITLLFGGEARLVALPFASLVTGVAVVLIAAILSPHAFTGLRQASGRHFAEAVLFAALTAMLAILWSDYLSGLEGAGANPAHSIREALGTGWALFVIAVTPAIFEEIAFRGIVQSRFMALFGRTQGILITGMTFGLCHGITAGLPFQVGLGIWLCSLRERSGSLLPGMLAHGLYNAALVLAG